jgi:hypothetical protein
VGREASGWLLAYVSCCVLTGCPLAADDDYSFGGATSGGTADALCADDQVPTGVFCPLQCTGGCERGTCVINCLGAQVCREAAIACPERFACRIRCQGEQSCERANFSCAALHRCELDCQQAAACKEARLACSSGSCQISCGDQGACESTELKCFAGGVCAAVCAGSTPEVKGCAEACSCQTCS